MMNFIWIALCFLLMALGIIGCFVYKIPGPLLCFLGVLAGHFGADMFEMSAVIISGAAVIVCFILNKILPKITSKLYPFGKGGKWGSFLGSILGLALLLATCSNASTGVIILLVIAAVVLIPYVASFLGELIAKKNVEESLKAAFSAWLTFFLSTYIKLAVCCYCIYMAFTTIG